MAPEVWERLRSVFAEAADLGKAERTYYLDSLYPQGSPERQEVERLLAAHDSPGDLPETARNLPWGLASEESALAPGEVISERFRLTRSIGRGGMGEVFEAEDVDLGGRVALKTIRSEWQEEGEFLARFKREIQIARRLTHPHLCRIFDGGRHVRADGHEVVYLTMELVEGETLAERVQRNGPLPIEEAESIVSQMLAGLSALHDAGVVHRDLKPGNVMLARTPQGRSRAVLMDFGLARSVAEPGPSGAQTRSGMVVGTPDYMAPEQLLGKPAGPATDLFSLGVLLHYMLTSAAPWPGEDRWNAAPVALRRIRPGAPKLWEEAIERCLRRDPVERPQSVAELAGLLGVAPAGASSAERMALPRRKTAWRWAAAVFVILVALLGSVLRDQWQKKAAPEAAGEWRIAVLPFEAVGGEPALDGSAAGLGDVIARRLSQFDGPAGEAMITSPGEVSGRGIESPSQALEQLGARLVVEGSLLANGNEVELTLAVVDTQTSRTIDSATVDAARGDLVGLQRQAVARLSRMLSLRLKPENAEAPLDLAPGSYEFYVQGRGYLQRDDQLDQVEIAEGLFRKALAADPDFADAQAGLAAALWQKFKRTSNPDWIALAVAEAEKALAVDPESAEAHVTLGLAKNRRPETQDEALDHFNRVLAADPNNGEALEGLADTYKRMGRKEEAEAAYRDMLARRRGDWRAYKQAALFYEGQGDYDNAFRLLKNALALTPDNAEIWGTLGTFQHLNGNLKGAIDSLEHSVSLEPTQATLTNLGSLYLKRGETHEAVRVLEQASAMPRSGYVTWAVLARAYDQAHRKREKVEAAKEAARLASRVLAEDPNNTNAILGLAVAKVLLNLNSEAVSLAEQAYAVQQDSPRTIAGAATVLADSGRADRAHQLFCEAVSKGAAPSVFDGIPSIRDVVSKLGPCSFALADSEDDTTARKE